MTRRSLAVPLENGHKPSRLPPVRQRLVRRLGEIGVIVLYSMVAILTFSS